MNKYIIALACFVCYLFYSQLKALEKDFLALKSDTNNILVVNSILRDKFDIKENEIKDRDNQIAKYSANYEAFNGTGCANCHLDVNKMLPYTDKALDFDEYVKVVCTGIGDIMPSYINSPKKGMRDITDSELRRQFKILKTYETQSLRK